MLRSRRFSVTPSTAIALLALFFAFGGSAFAVGEKIQSLTAAQQRCANGAVRGVATVVGDSAGMANIPDRFTNRKSLFARTFNCTGRATEVRRVTTGVFEVRFTGNGARSALANGVGGTLASVDSLGGATFKVSLYSAGRDDPAEVAFTVVAF